MLKNILFSDSIHKKLARGASVLALSSFVMANPASVLAQEDATGYYSPGYKPMTNDQFLSLSKPSPELYLFRAEYAIKNEDWDHAIIYLRKSLDMYDDDIDTHKYLALSLEEKMKQQDEKDPKLFRECVKEWLIVARQTKGAEKGLTFKNGVSFGNMVKRYGDEEGSLMAFAHLTKLTGRPPGKFESDKKYLAKCGKPAEQEVAGKVLKKKPSDNIE